jgi:hypothetical protein
MATERLPAAPTYGYRKITCGTERASAVENSIIRTHIWGDCGISMRPYKKNKKTEAVTVWATLTERLEP